MSAPVYPDFKPVGLEDREFITDRLARRPSTVCEMNFSNIFIWRESERPRATLLNDNLCILVEPTFEPAYFLPPIGDNAIPETVAMCLTHTPRLSRVPEDFVARYGAGFKTEEDRDNFDYLYRREDLAELAGKKYDGKRNRIKKFEAGTKFAYEPLGRQHAEECRRLLNRWCEGKADDSPYMKAEREAIREAIVRFGELRLKGAVVTVDDRVEAFTIGTALNPSTAVIQIEIANPDLTGLAQWINREFVRREWRDFAFINREQDLGVPGLRRAKLSYQPAELVRKFNLTGQT
jgi:uncharacterized protein